MRAALSPCVGAICRLLWACACDLAWLDLRRELVARCKPQVDVAGPSSRWTFLRCPKAQIPMHGATVTVRREPTRLDQLIRFSIAIWVLLRHLFRSDLRQSQQAARYIPVNCVAKAEVSTLPPDVKS